LSVGGEILLVRQARAATVAALNLSRARTACTGTCGWRQLDVTREPGL